MSRFAGPPRIEIAIAATAEANVDVAADVAAEAGAVEVAVVTNPTKTLSRRTSGRDVDPAPRV